MAYDLNKLAETYKNLANKEKNKQNGESDFFRIEEGSNLVRILPAKDEDLPFFTHTRIHTVHNDGKFQYIHCRKVHGESCPLCDAYYEMWKRHKAGNTEIAEKFGRGATSIKPKDRYYMNAVNRKDDSVKVLSLPEKLFKTLMSYMVGDDDLGIEALGDVTDVKEGYDFNIIATRQDAFLDYSQSRMKNKASMAGKNEKQISEFLDARHDLNALVKLEDFAFMKQMADTILSGAMITSKPEEEDKPKAEVTEEEFKKSLKG